MRYAVVENKKCVNVIEATKQNKNEFGECYRVGLNVLIGDSFDYEKNMFYRIEDEFEFKRNEDGSVMHDENDQPILEKVGESISYFSVLEE